MVNIELFKILAHLKGQPRVVGDGYCATLIQIPPYQVSLGSLWLSVSTVTPVYKTQYRSEGVMRTAVFVFIGI